MLAGFGLFMGFRSKRRGAAAPVGPSGDDLTNEASDILTDEAGNTLTTE